MVLPNLNFSPPEEQEEDVNNPGIALLHESAKNNYLRKFD
jgi:hypothetical protein